MTSQELDSKKKDISDISHHVRKLITKLPQFSPSKCPFSQESPTQSQIDLVRITWERVTEITLPSDRLNVSPAHAFGLVFYEALFQLDEEIEGLFSNVFQQARAMAGMISFIARAPQVTGATNISCCGAAPQSSPSIREINLQKRSKLENFQEGDPEWLVEKIRELGARHYFYDVQPHHLAWVGPAFVTALKKRLGNEYTDEIGEAWIKVNILDESISSSVLTLFLHIVFAIDLAIRLVIMLPII
jgi:hemoglobin-like flavoprotein